MTRSNKITYVAHGYERAWRAYWVGSEIVAAGRLEKAITIVAQRHPGCTVMREGRSRIARGLKSDVV